MSSAWLCLRERRKTSFTWFCLRERRKTSFTWFCLQERRKTISTWLCWWERRKQILLNFVGERVLLWKCSFDNSQKDMMREETGLSAFSRILLDLLRYRYKLSIIRSILFIKSTINLNGFSQWKLANHK